MSSLPEPRVRRVIKRPSSICPAAPHVTERLASASTVLDDPDTAGPSLVEQVRRAAYDDGRRDGLDEAMASTSARRAASLEQLCNRLADAAEQAAAARAAIVEEVVGDLATVVAEIVEALVGTVEWPETPAGSALARALALAPQGPELVARIHPDAGLSDDDVAMLTARTGVALVHDHTVDPSGCVVEVGSCTIDAQLSSALARVRRQFEGMTVPTSRRAVTA